MAEDNARKKLKRRAAIVALVVLALLVGGWIALDRHGLAELERSRAALLAAAEQAGVREADWVEPPGPDAAALKLEELAGRLGYTLRIDCDRGPAPPWEDEERQDHRRRLGAQVRTELERAGTGVGRAWRERDPGDWWRDHSTDLDELADLLADGPLPSWGPVGALCPDLNGAQVQGELGLLWLTASLHAHALDALAEGRQEEAERRLLAAWRLRSSRSERRGDDFAQIISMSLIREQAAILRRLDTAGAAWIERLESEDPMGRAASSLFAAGYLAPRTWLDEDSFAERVAQSPQPSDDAAPYVRFAALWPVRTFRFDGLGRPWLRLGTADVVNSYRVMATALAGAGRCALQPAEVTRAVEQAQLERAAWVSRGIGREDLHARAATAQLQLDLTLAVLRGREQGFVDGQTIEASCPDQAWTVNRWPDGQWTLTLTGASGLGRFSQVAREWSGPGPDGEAPPEP